MTARTSTTKAFAVGGAVGTLLLAAAVTMWAIIADPPGDTVGRAFVSLVLMSGFTFAVIGEAQASDRRSEWVATTRVAGLVLIAGAGLYLTWHQVDPRPWTDLSPDLGAFLIIVTLVEGVACTLALVAAAWTRRMRTPVSRTALAAGIALVGACAVAIAVPFAFWDSGVFGSIYWRTVLALAVLAVVLLAIPMVVDAILAPKRPKGPQPVPLTAFGPPPGPYAWTPEGGQSGPMPSPYPTQPPAPPYPTQPPAPYPTQPPPVARPS